MDLTGAFCCNDKIPKLSVDAESFGMNSKCINVSLARTLWMETECDIEINKAILMVGEGESFISFLCENSGDITNVPGSLSATCEWLPLLVIYADLVCPTILDGMMFVITKMFPIIACDEVELRCGSNYPNATTQRWIKLPKEIKQWMLGKYTIFSCHWLD